MTTLVIIILGLLAIGIAFGFAPGSSPARLISAAIICTIALFVSYLHGVGEVGTYMSLGSKRIYLCHGTVAVRDQVVAMMEETFPNPQRAKIRAISFPREESPIEGESYIWSARDNRFVRF